MRMATAILAGFLLVGCGSEPTAPAVTCHYSFTRVRVVAEVERVLFLYPIRANPANSCYLLRDEMEPVPGIYGVFQRVETWECRICNDSAPE